jgi:nucleotide-binding universal stress UspA family protein
MRVAIAYDGSEHAKAAVDDLRRSGLPRDAHALVIASGETLLPVQPAGSPLVTAASRGIRSALRQAHAEASRVIDHGRVIAAQGRAHTQRVCPGWQVEAEVVIGAPAEAVMRIAEVWGADLIVTGSRGRSTIGRVVLGSVSQQIATNFSRSVRVARQVSPRGDAPIRIILGVDGSRGATAAARAVACRAWPKGTEVRVIGVDETVAPTITAKLVPQAAAIVAETYHLQWRKARRTTLAVARVLRRLRGVAVDAVFPKGSASKLLCDEAANWGADCIFVGSRGFSSALERLRMGSVSAAVVVNAPCTVEVIR